MLIADYSVCIPIITRNREIIRMKSVHSRFREQKAHKTPKRALPFEIACCKGPAIKALNCCVMPLTTTLITEDRGGSRNLGRRGHIKGVGAGGGCAPSRAKRGSFEQYSNTDTHS